MKNVPTKDPGDLYTADDFNKLTSEELKNVVTSTNQTLDEVNQKQLLTAITRLAGGQTNSSFFIDAGEHPNHVLAYGGALSGFMPFDNYEDGLTIKFVAKFGNDGTVLNTINIQGLGEVPILGSDLGYSIVEGSMVNATYFNGNFYIDSQSGPGDYLLLLMKVLQGQIGEKLIVDYPKDQNAGSLLLGNFRCLLCNGQVFTAEEYPLLAEIYPDLKVPDYSNLVLKHISEDSERVRGDVEEEHVGTHLHSLPDTISEFYTPAYRRSSPDNVEIQGLVCIRDTTKAGGFSLDCSMDVGATKPTACSGGLKVADVIIDSNICEFRRVAGDGYTISFSTHQAGLVKTDNSNIGPNIVTNLGVQYYVKAKVIL